MRWVAAGLVTGLSALAGASVVTPEGATAREDECLQPYEVLDLELTAISVVGDGPIPPGAEDWRADAEIRAHFLHFAGYEGGTIELELAP